MKTWGTKRLAALALAACLPLSGCKAMLERSYSAATPHVDRPATAEDPSVLRVENYQELVSAILFLVSQRSEEGTIQLHNYDGEEEDDLTAACLEAATQDPLGAYAVDYIKHELSRVVSYYQATLAIHYRRTAEQVESMVSVNGAGDIRDELQTALGEFAPEVVLRAPYFFGDEDTVTALLREAYYAAPGTALGLPEAEVELYPDSGRERIVEVLLTYPEETASLEEKKEKLERRAEEFLPGGAGLDREDAARLALSALWGAGGETEAPAEQPTAAAYAPDGGHTPYDALVEGTADSEGMALAYALLCAREEVPCRVVEGSLNGQPWFWNEIERSGGAALYVDPCFFPERQTALFTEEEFSEMGYLLRQT